VIVLEELSKICSATETELVEYLSLYFDDASAKEERAVLLRIEGGQIAIRTAEANGHCHKIENIYDRYLNPWFQRVLSRQENSDVQKLFDLLTRFDDNVIRDLAELANWLIREATATLNLVEVKKYDEANSRISAARKEVLPVRQAITNAIVDLRTLQADFIGAAGVT